MMFEMVPIAGTSRVKDTAEDRAANNADDEGHDSAEDQSADYTSG